MTLERGTSLFDGVSRGANMLGAPLAGVLIAVVGPTQRARARRGDVRRVGAADVRLRPGERAAAAEADAEGYLAQLREGYRFLWRTPLVRAIVIMVLVTNTLDAGMGGVLMPVYADQRARQRRRARPDGRCDGADGVRRHARLRLDRPSRAAPRDARDRLHARRPVPLLPPRGDAGDRPCGDRLRDRGDRDRADQPDPRARSATSAFRPSCGPASSARSRPG